MLDHYSRADRARMAGDELVGELMGQARSTDDEVQALLLRRAASAVTEELTRLDECDNEEAGRWLIEFMLRLDLILDGRRPRRAF